MASATNVENLAQAGLGDFEVRPNDLVVAVSGHRGGLRRGTRDSPTRCCRSPRPATATMPAAKAPVTSIQMANAQDADLNLALISVPGDYAAAEAMKALRLGMDVMVFSDNVTPGSRAGDQDLRPRRRPDGDGAGLRDLDRQRHPAGVRQRRAARPDRRRRRLRHRDAGGHRPDPPGRLRGVPGAGHRRPRPGRRDRRHLDAARAGRPRRRPRHRR